MSRGEGSGAAAGALPDQALSDTGATPLTLISMMATALKMNCAVETRPGSGSAFKQSLLTRSIEALDIEYIIIAETDALVSLASSGIFFESLRAATPQRDPVSCVFACYWLARRKFGDALRGAKRGKHAKRRDQRIKSSHPLGSIDRGPERPQLLAAVELHRLHPARWWE